MGVNTQDMYKMIKRNSLGGVVGGAKEKSGNNKTIGIWIGSDEH